VSDHYILIGQTPVPLDCDPYTPQGIANLIQWGRELETCDRRVAFTRVLGLCYVSTVFLGLDHNYERLMGGDGPPILFESMTFWAGDGGDEQERCATWSEAEEIHRQMVAEVTHPRAVLRYIGRRWSAAYRAALKDLGARWRELQGLGPKRYSDDMLNMAMDSWDQLQKLRSEREDREWMIFG
jgi:hypothetical protein